MLQAVNNAASLRSSDTGRRHVEGAPRVRPTEPPSLPWLIDVLSRMSSVHVRHLCIDKLHVEDLNIVSAQALSVGLCATCCRHPMPLASGDNVEALAERLEEGAKTYDAAN